MERQAACHYFQSCLTIIHVGNVFVFCFVFADTFVCAVFPACEMAGEIILETELVEMISKRNSHRDGP